MSFRQHWVVNIRIIILLWRLHLDCPFGDNYIRDKIQKLIDENDLYDVAFHSLRHTSVTYKLKLSGGDIKAVQSDSGYA